MNVERHLRPLRQALVIAAEKVMTETFEQANSAHMKLKKTQMNHLVGICGEASCREEIENYIRYQAGRRDSSGWTPELASKIIGGVAPTLTALGGHADAPTLQAAAWRLYAIYLTRAFTFQVARSKSGAGRAPDGNHEHLEDDGRMQPPLAAPGHDAGTHQQRQGPLRDAAPFRTPSPNHSPKKGPRT